MTKEQINDYFEKQRESLYEDAEEHAKRKIELLKKTYPYKYDDDYFEKNNYEERYTLEYIKQAAFSRACIEDYFKKKGILNV